MFHKKDHLRYLRAEFVLVALLVAIPLSVHAGVFASLFAHTNTNEPSEPDVFSIGTHAPFDATVLSAATHHNPQAAIGGGDIIVDAGSLIPSGTIGPDDVEEQHMSSEISVYTVRPGDTPSQIAEMYDVSVNTIYWANDIKNGVIQPGDTLVILPITGVRHVVKDGETLSSIVKKYGGDVDEVLAYNQLSTADELSIGDTVVIPNGVVENASPKRVATAEPVSVSGAVNTGASYYAHPLPGARRTQGLHGHNGIDFGAGVGTPIRAAAAGEVIVSRSGGWNGGYGNYVVIRHPNGTQTLYAHNSSNAVGVGAYVAQGEVIGYVGNTGRSTGSHLHFEVRGATNPF